MKRHQSARLGTEKSHYLGGTDIDRSRPLSFKVDGREVQGYFGDTVLSALLASGIETAGVHASAPLALDERFSPPVVPRSVRHDPRRVVPMDRAPALDGLELVSYGPTASKGLGARFGRMFSGRSRSLGHHFAPSGSLAEPWFDLQPEASRRFDLIVVGGGLAGMSAALAAGEVGDAVALVERRPRLGGDARYFGTMEGEEPVQASIVRLSAALADCPNVSVFTRSEAFAVYDGAVRVHSVEEGNATFESRVHTLEAPRVVLATGAIERLPIFPGNRLPRVSGALAAFRLADRYGVWPGRRAVISTISSHAYRVATLASDAGIVIQKICDARLRPQSRFIEFAKAYGMPQAQGLFAVEAVPMRGRSEAVMVVLASSYEDVKAPQDPVETDRLLISGGFQADLTLWHMAGGLSRWDETTATLLPQGEVAGMTLAGSVEGYSTASACIHAGRNAAARLFGRAVYKVEDIVLDAIYETPEGPTPVAPWREKKTGATYLDGGASLVMRPRPVAPEKVLFFERPQKRWPLADEARPLSVCDVAAGVQLRSVPADEAGRVAQERSVLAGDLADAGREAPASADDPAPDPVPAYLAGRFGANASVWRIEAAEQRKFEPGELIYPNTDRPDPLKAVGVVLGGDADGTRVLVRAEVASDGRQVFVRDISRFVPVRLVFRPEADAGASAEARGADPRALASPPPIGA